MLPNLSEKRSVSFGTAVQEPAFISARRNALLDLKSVSAIRVSCSMDRSEARYAIEVFTDSLHCRPTTATNSTASVSAISIDAVVGPEESCLQTPAVRIERTLEEFADLRHKLYRTMFLAHHRQYCKFCQAVLDLVISGVDPSGIFCTLFGKERVAHKLTKFLDELLVSIVENACTSTRGCCSAQTLIPETLHAFLFTPSATNNTA